MRSRSAYTPHTRALMLTAASANGQNVTHVCVCVLCVCLRIARAKAHSRKAKNVI